MKTRQFSRKSIAFLFMVAVFFCSLQSLSFGQNTVNIPDPNLRARIETALGKASGAPITAADMGTLIQFDSGLNANISNLTGLEYATNLTELDLTFNSVTDISAISGLTKLTKLDLDGNNIMDISAIEDLTNLTWLNLWDNNVTDISAVSGLTKLTHLNLHGNNILDISAIEDLTNLTWLDLGDNNITDISAVSGLTKLESLDLRGNNISDLAPLVANTGLGWGNVLVITQNPLSSLSINTHIPTLQQRRVTVSFDAVVEQPVDTTPTVNIPDSNLRAKIETVLGKASGAPITTTDIATLTELNADSANISNLTGLEYATNLIELWLNDNNISDVSAVSELTNLTGLWIGDNTISDVSAVRGLTNLTWLYLRGNNILDTSAVRGLTNLTRLWLDDNTISDISAVAELTNLTELYLGDNTISDISAVAGLTNLTTLNLQSNNIPDISWVRGLTNLTHLSLGGNNISNISPVAGLTNLTKLSLGRNNISDLSSLVGNTGLGIGDRVDLQRNPLSSLSINTHIPTLQRRGVEVWFDEEVVQQPVDTTPTEEVEQPVDTSPTVNIPDPNLRDRIETALGKAAGARITTADMATLTLLDAQSANISRLTGIEYATNLIHLLLSNNNITDISPVAGLTNLTWLSLYGNNVTDLSSLIGNTGLGERDVVDVQANPLSSESINTHIPTLQQRGVEVQFDAVVVQPVDTTPPVNIPDPNLRDRIETALGKAAGAPITTADMETLTLLDAGSANISRLTGLEYATNLSQLLLQSNSISDISALVGLTQLTGLNLQKNPLNDAAISTHIPAIQANGTTVYFDNRVVTTPQQPVVLIPDANLRAAVQQVIGNQITTNTMLNLTSLIANDRGIRDLTGLEYATNLSQLLLQNNSISNISALSGLTQLTELLLQSNSISDISALAQMTQLWRLFLWDNNISNISALSRMTQLTELGLGGNSISNISSLSGLTQLAHLDLPDNAILDIAPLARLTRLEWLEISDNNISDVSALAGLTQLTTLQLRNNSISDISALSGLTQLTGLYLQKNPLNDAAFSTHIPAIQANGTTVYFDNRVVTTPQPPVVLIPDANLRAAVQQVIGNQITTDTMLNLTYLYANDHGVRDLTGLEYATNLIELSIHNNSISNISALSGLTQLRKLWLNNNSISDISALSGLTQLSRLYLPANNISNISPLSGLTQLTELLLQSNSISDLSPLAGNMGLGVGDIVDVTGNSLSSLSINAHIPTLQGRGVDVRFDAVVAQTVNIPDPNLRAKIETALGKAAGATITTADMATLTTLYASRFDIMMDDGMGIADDISNLTGLEHATNLTNLYLGGNSISDISSVAGLTNLTALELWDNNISDLSALSGLTNLTELYLWGNSISDIPSVAGLTNLTVLELSVNNISDLSALSGLTNLTELNLWDNNISDLSPLVGNTGLGAGDTVDVTGNPLIAGSIDTHIPTLQRRGVEVWFDAVAPSSPPTNTTVSVSPASVESPSIGNQLTVSLKIVNGQNVAGYQATVQFDGTALRFVSSAIGDYLSAGAFSLPATESGNTVTLGATSLAGESAGDGTLATITFEVIAVRPSTVTLSDVLLTDRAGTTTAPRIENAEITTAPRLQEDVNEDGIVNIIDLTLVASNFGIQGTNAADVNGDGIVNIIDLTLVAAAFGNTAAAPGIWYIHLDGMPARSDVEAWLRDARQVNLSDPTFQRGILFMEQLVTALTPKETALLPNFPNPFNPETWIPYRLAQEAEVHVAIYDINGALMRILDLGRQTAGFYTDKGSAAYWDGRNHQGEAVRNGVYFYQLRVGEYVQTRKMLIRK